MLATRHRMYFWVGWIVLASWASLTILDPDPGRGLSETLVLGYFFGSMFGHTTLAAAWAAFGPGKLIWRLPLSFVWVVMLAVAVAVNIFVHGGPEDAVVMLGACFIGQWLLLQIPLWALVLGLRVQLRETHSSEQNFDPRQWQFGIRQLIIVTAIVGVVFGIGRLIVGNISGSVRGEAAIFIFLAIAASVLTLPLLLAALMRHKALLGVVLSLVVIGLASAVEVPLLRTVYKGSGPEIADFIAINAFSAAMILILALVVRWNGFFLGQAPMKALAVAPQ